MWWILACVHHRSEVGVWPTIEGCTLSKFLDKHASDDWERVKPCNCCTCVFMVCMSHREKGRQGETEEAVFREYIGTNAAAWWDIEVGICFFFFQHKDALHFCCSVIFCHNDRVSLVSIQTGWQESPPICCLHSKVKTTNAAYPHFDRSLLHP